MDQHCSLRLLQSNKEQLLADLNVTGVWAQGITGHGITVNIIDDGIESTHPDLKDNFVRMFMPKR